MSESGERAAIQAPTILPASGETTASEKVNEALVLVIAWSAAEPDRIGEVAIFPKSEPPRVLGRGASPDGEEPRVRFCRQRPSGVVPAKLLSASGLSRRQLLVEVEGDALRITRIGQNPVEVNGRLTDVSTVFPGDVINIRPEMLLFCTR